MIDVHREASIPVLPTYELKSYRNDDTQTLYIPIHNLLNAGVPRSAFVDKEHKGFGKPKLKHVITVNYFGKKINCVKVGKFVDLLAASSTPLGKAVLSEIMMNGLRQSTKHLQKGESARIKLGNKEVNF